MTNKPMLSVDRELLERLLQAGLNAVGMGCNTPAEELRALLDKPAAELNPEHTLFNEIRTSAPVNDEDEPLQYLVSEQQLQRIRHLESPAAQHQGEPVACLTRSRNILTQASIAVDGKDHFSAWSEWAPNSIEYGRAVTDPIRNNPVCYEIELLFKEQPAPVAVVMPELKTPYYKVVPTKFGNKEGFWQITPDSSIVYDNRDEAQARADARNASRAQHFFDSLKPCLEEVARLNGVNL